MRRVVVTGLGFISSIGNNRAEVLDSLLNQRTGIEFYPELDLPISPVRLAGTIKGFSFPPSVMRPGNFQREFPFHALIFAPWRRMSLMPTWP